MAPATTSTDAVCPDFAPDHDRTPADDSVRPCGTELFVCGDHPGTAGVVELVIAHVQPDDGQLVAVSVAFVETLLFAGCVITGAPGTAPPCSHGRDLSHAIGGVDWHPSVAAPLVVVPIRGVTVLEPPPSVPPVFFVHGLGLYTALWAV